MMTQSEVPVNPSQSDLRILWLPALICVLLLSVELYLLFSDWSSSDRAKINSDAIPIAVYVSGKNDVRQKSVGTIVWEVPTPEMQLYRESAIATMDGAEAILRFKDDSELVVEPNSLLILEEAPSGLTTGQTGRIVARLVKGSIKRKSKNTDTPLFLKLSKEKTAEPILIQDKRGDSIFRVIYRVKGYEVVVESGSVVVNGKNNLETGQNIATGEPAKLSAPVLKKPKVEIFHAEEPTPPPALKKKTKKKKSRAQAFWDFLFPRAYAANPSKLAIRFSWEETPGASQYVIQISQNSDFEPVLIEKRVPQLEFIHEMTPPSEKTQLYFRVAGVTGDGLVGEFSEIEKVEVKPEPTPKPTAAPEPIPAIVTATPKPKATPLPKKEPPKIIEAPVASTIKPGESTHSLWIWGGARLENRKFKSETAPQVVSGSGFVPTSVGFDLQQLMENKHYLWVGGSYVYEKAKADLPSPADKAFNVSSLSGWATYGRTFQVGPYIGSSRKITSNGFLFESQNVFLIGAAFVLQSDAAILFRRGGVGWRAQVAALGVGGKGIDASVWLRKGWVRSGFIQGIFYGVKVETRQIDIESSFNGALEIGFKL